MPDLRPEIQYATLAQQSETAQLGMWVFLATEVLFFGGIMLAYEVYRTTYPAAFAAAMAESVIVIGAINTALLLTSSFTMALAVHWTATGLPRRATGSLIVTAGLGLAFLVLKGLEYYIDYQDHVVPRLGFEMHGVPRGPAELFWLFYFYATGLHAIHLTIGIVVLAVMIVHSWRRKFVPQSHNLLEVAGLYWSFIDIVWVFLFALIYPIGRVVS
jgi:cytochrome c oxidase subunit 3